MFPIQTFLRGGGGAINNCLHSKLQNILQPLHPIQTEPQQEGPLQQEALQDAP